MAAPPSADAALKQCLGIFSVLTTEADRCDEIHHADDELIEQYPPGSFVKAVFDSGGDAEYAIPPFHRGDKFCVIAQHDGGWLETLEGYIMISWVMPCAPPPDSDSVRLRCMSMRASRQQQQSEQQQQQSEQQQSEQQQQPIQQQPIQQPPKQQRPIIASQQRQIGIPSTSSSTTHRAPMSTTATATATATLIGSTIVMEPDVVRLRRGVCTISLTNNSPQPVHFEFVYPAQALDVSPGRGEIASYTSVSVVVRSRVRTRTLAPHMYVLLNGMEHKLQITCDPEDDSATAVMHAPVGPVSGSLREPTHLPLRGSLPWNISDKPVNGGGGVGVSGGGMGSDGGNLRASTISMGGLESKPKQAFRVRQPNVIFPDARAGSVVESTLIAENVSNDTMHWTLVPIGPVQLKLPNNTGLSVAHGAFQFRRATGTLTGRRYVPLALTFSPRDPGQYSQDWELRFEPSTPSSSTTTQQQQQQPGGGVIKLLLRGVSARR